MDLVREGYRRLVSAAEDGRLGELCRAHRISLLTVFGSATRDDESPSDLDVAIRFGARSPTDILAVAEALAELSGTSRIDLLDLSRAEPVARARALVGGEPLYEAEQGAYLLEQSRAVEEYLDTMWLRDIERRRLAS